MAANPGIIDSVGSLTLVELKGAVTGMGAAFRSVTKLQPVGGEGDKVFPVTYSGGA